MVKVSVISRTEYGKQLSEYLKSAQEVLDRHCSCQDNSCTVILAELPSRRIEATVIRPRPVETQSDWDELTDSGQYRRLFERRTPASRIRDSLAKIVGAPLTPGPSLSTMESFAWSPAYSVGIRQLDEQHKQIIEMIRVLEEAGPVSVRSELISETLGRLTLIASQHFDTEEELLELHGYPDLAEQRDDHRNYRLAVAMLCVDATNHKESVPRDLLRFLKEWWQRHILEKDVKYRTFFRSRGFK